MKVFLSIPSNHFTEEFLDTKVKTDIDVRGDMILYYLREEPVHKPNNCLFAHEAIYNCKLVNNNVVLIGATN